MSSNAAPCRRQWSNEDCRARRTMRSWRAKDVGRVHGAYSYRKGAGGKAGKALELWIPLHPRDGPAGAGARVCDPKQFTDSGCMRIRRSRLSLRTLPAGPQTRAPAAPAMIRHFDHIAVAEPDVGRLPGLLQSRIHSFVLSDIGSRRVTFTRDRSDEETRMFRADDVPRRWPMGA